MNNPQPIADFKVDSAPISAAATGDPVLNTTELLERCLGNEALARRILERFETEFSTSLDELAGLFQEESREQLGRLAHRLKGAAANVAATRLSQRLSTVQDLIESEPIETIAAEVDSLHREFQELEQFRAKWLG